MKLVATVTKLAITCTYDSALIFSQLLDSFQFRAIYTHFSPLAIGHRFLLRMHKLYYTDLKLIVYLAE